MQHTSLLYCKVLWKPSPGEKIGILKHPFPKNNVYTLCMDLSQQKMYPHLVQKYMGGGICTHSCQGLHRFCKFLFLFTHIKILHIQLKVKKNITNLIKSKKKSCCHQLFWFTILRISHCVYLCCAVLGCAWLGPACFTKRQLSCDRLLPDCTWLSGDHFSWLLLPA